MGLTAHADPGRPWDDISLQSAPLIDASYRTGLADEALHLRRLDSQLAVALGTVLIVATSSLEGIPREVSERFPGPMAFLGEFAGVRYHALRVPDIGALFLQLRTLQALPGVRGAWPDTLQIELSAAPALVVHPRFDTGPYTPVDALRIEELWKQGDGRGVRVALIDSALDPTSHGFTAHPIEQRDPWPRLRRLPSLPPGQGHGTRVASIIGAVGQDVGPRGVAPGVELIAITLRSTWTSELIAALYQAQHADADIVVCAWELPRVPTAVAKILDRLVRPNASKPGMLIVVAAGNPHADISARDGLANHRAVLAVSALDHHGQLIAAYGDGVDIAAPSMLPALPLRPDGTPNYLGKTSAATPLVAGIAALLRSAFPQLDMPTVGDILKTSATPLPAPAAGFGALSPREAFRLAAARAEALR